jgi:hypothetical protein
MSARFSRIRKPVILILGLLLFVLAGMDFYASRHMREPVVLGPGVTRVTTLGEYFPGIYNTANDCRIYFLEGKEPGATMMVLGGTHPEEPAGRLAAWIVAENAVMEKGRLIVAISANRSASTVTRISGAYPPDFTIATDWGEQKFRMGDRWSNPLDQWPDPEVYIHYPSRQNLAYVDIRNLNRTWPGRPDGSLTERTCFAFMELIRKEKVDILVDLHEAELQYPVISTIVAHENGLELATLTSMTLTDEGDFGIGTEFSPKNLHGLSHREVGDFSDAISLLLEAPEPFLDAVRGRTDRELLLTGRDEFIVKAGKHGLLHERIDERGWPIEIRVGRHASTILAIMDAWNSSHADRPFMCGGMPRYREIVAKGIGAFLRDPSKAPPDRLVFE